MGQSVSIKIGCGKRLSLQVSTEVPRLRTETLRSQGSRRTCRGGLHRTKALPRLQ